jgi:hypothetical protein
MGSSAARRLTVIGGPHAESRPHQNGTSYTLVSAIKMHSQPAEMSQLPEILY